MVERRPLLPATTATSVAVVAGSRVMLIRNFAHIEILIFVKVSAEMKLD